AATGEPGPNTTPTTAVDANTTTAGDVATGDSGSVSGTGEPEVGVGGSGSLAAATTDDWMVSSEVDAIEVDASASALAGVMARDPDGRFRDSELLRFAKRLGEGTLRVSGDKVLALVSSGLGLELYRGTRCLLLFRQGRRG
ncbi:unnamed protein product, partial [Laminaria digitata]